MILLGLPVGIRCCGVNEVKVMKSVIDRCKEVMFKNDSVIAGVFF